MDAQTLSKLPVSELEQLYLQPQELTMPAPGSYRGHYLASLDSGRIPLVLRRPLQLMFELPPWKVHIEGDRGHWSFFHDGLAMGAMDLRPGMSRWRFTEVVQLTYARTRLPRPIKWLLYDEVKPLSPDLCLGLGGINHPRPRSGEVFFFMLTKG